MYDPRFHELAERIGRDDPVVQYYQWHFDHGNEDAAYRGLCHYARTEIGFDPELPPDPYEAWSDVDNFHVPNGIEIGEHHGTGLSVSITLDEILDGGCLLCGSTGSGKTTLAYGLVTELLNHDCTYPRHSTP